MTPAKPPISKPPTLASTSIGSSGFGLLIDKALSMTSTLWASCSSSMPVPRPVAFMAGLPLIAARMALLAVVLPIPISPVAMRSSPFFASASTSSMPTFTASTACRCVIAGPFAMFLVPKSTILHNNPGSGWKPPITPISTIITRAPI